LAQILAARKAGGGAGSITAQQNLDVKNFWDEATGMLKERNLQFESFYTRYLEHDDLSVVPR